MQRWSRPPAKTSTNLRNIVFCLVVLLFIVILISYLDDSDESFFLRIASFLTTSSSAHETGTDSSSSSSQKDNSLLLVFTSDPPEVLQEQEENLIKKIIPSASERNFPELVLSGSFSPTVTSGLSSLPPTMVSCWNRRFYGIVMKPVIDVSGASSLFSSVSKYGNNYLDSKDGLASFYENQRRIFEAFEKNESDLLTKILGSDNGARLVHLLDAPRFVDEAMFCNQRLNLLTTISSNGENENEKISRDFAKDLIDSHYRPIYLNIVESAKNNQHQFLPPYPIAYDGEDRKTIKKPDNSFFSSTWDDFLMDVDSMDEVVFMLHRLFSRYDQLLSAKVANKTKGEGTNQEVIHVLGTSCYGNADCRQIIFGLMYSLFSTSEASSSSSSSTPIVGIGHFIVVLNVDQDDNEQHGLKWVRFFSTLEIYFPGRFTKFHRPQRLSIAETWNLIIRTGFSIRPMPEEILIVANPSWKFTPNAIKNNHDETDFSGDCFISSRITSRSESLQLLHPDFSAFYFTKFAYFDVGYFDESIADDFYARYFTFYSTTSNVEVGATSRDELLKHFDQHRSSISVRVSGGGASGTRKRSSILRQRHKTISPMPSASSTLLDFMIRATVATLRGKKQGGRGPFALISRWKSCGALSADQVPSDSYSEDSSAPGWMRRILLQARYNKNNKKLAKRYRRRFARFAEDNYLFLKWGTTTVSSMKENEVKPMLLTATIRSEFELSQLDRDKPRNILNAMARQIENWMTKQNGENNNRNFDIFPFDMQEIRYNNSFVVDSGQRKCLITGKGRKYRNSRQGKCFFHPWSLKKEIGGLIKNKKRKFPSKLTKYDAFVLP